MKRVLLLASLIASLELGAQTPETMQSKGGCPFHFGASGSGKNPHGESKGGVNPHSAGVNPHGSGPNSNPADYKAADYTPENGENTTASLHNNRSVRNGQTNRDWWPNQLDLTVLRQNSDLSNPMGPNFNYRKEFSSLDYNALKKDIQ